MRRHPGSFGPVTSAYSTASWRPDEVVRVAHEIAIPADLLPGRYVLRIRLWTSRESAPGPRPRVEGHPDGSRWLTLTEIEVPPPG